MTLENAKLLDSVGWRLLNLLQQDARMSYKEMGDIVGLTPPAVADRIRRMEDAGIIRGYHAEIDLEAAGREILAFVHLSTNASQSFRFREIVDDVHEILECHCVTGNESYILKVAVPDVAQLEHTLIYLTNFGEVRTSLVLSSQVIRRDITGPYPPAE